MGRRGRRRRCRREGQRRRKTRPRRQGGAGSSFYPRCSQAAQAAERAARLKGRRRLRRLRRTAPCPSQAPPPPHTRPPAGGSPPPAGGLPRCFVAPAWPGAVQPRRERLGGERRTPPPGIGPHRRGLSCGAGAASPRAAGGGAWLLESGAGGPTCCARRAPARCERRRGARTAPARPASTPRLRPPPPRPLPGRPAARGCPRPRRWRERAAQTAARRRRRRRRGRYWPPEEKGEPPAELPGWVLFLRAGDTPVVPAARGRALAEPLLPATGSGGPRQSRRARQRVRPVCGWWSWRAAGSGAAQRKGCGSSDQAVQTGHLSS